MSPNSRRLQGLSALLQELSQRQSWQTSSPFEQLLQIWPDLVGISVAAQARPVRLERGILQVATISAVWAQNLQFERHHILAKVRQRLDLQVQEIRFSTALWSTVAASSLDPPVDRSTRTPVDRSTSTEHHQLWQNHPCRIPPDPTFTRDLASLSGAERSALRSALPHCPQCHCPTLQGELDRWSVCAFCAVKTW
ncbi:DciA family protein [Prochlorothrix hollandica]|uniref:RNA-binding protein containing Zn ribbon n=1 Tax=Prochlorothrix hollandica PCC 9006 = CALU 1027 TaxID=317619 RepID=A0A0M2PQ04_PROHO|nr:DUF721 domain-containing protein [Prochlorothrix hollandica]KKI98660.1 hypothetical protein PROH_17550 [Prochlorothrix hollandica PCC 9006 = CALU 1027]